LLVVDRADVSDGSVIKVRLNVTFKPTLMLVGDIARDNQWNP
jgi:hypothetical protein